MNRQYQQNRRSTLALFALTCLLPLLAACASGTSTGDTPQTGIANKGSDTMVNLALAWAEAYQAASPGIQLSITGGGSGTGIAALINGTVDIANASRSIKDEELSTAEANGVDPVEFTVALDAIAIVVNPQNPVDHLSIPQLAAMYTGEITNWSQVGGDDRPIVLLSRETNSGTHVYFLEEVVRQGNAHGTELFSPDTLLMPSSEGISAEVRQNPNAIGYDGLGYVTHDMKTLAVSVSDSGPFVLPTVATVKDGSYPIARTLFMYTNGQPTGDIKNYMDWIFTPEAQTIVEELGFVPID